MAAYDLTCQVAASYKLLCCIATLLVSSQLDSHLTNSGRCAGLDAIFDWVASRCWSYSVIVVCHKGRLARYEHAFMQNIVMLFMPRMSMPLLCHVSCTYMCKACSSQASYISTGTPTVQMDSATHIVCPEFVLMHQ